MPETSLVVVDPGHFHATLVQQQMYPELSLVVRVYAPLGPDLIDYLSRIAKYNRRPQAATDWRLDVYAGTDFLDRIQDEPPGGVVIFSGRNRGKIDRIGAALEAGLHVLADKPAIIEPADLPRLEAALIMANQQQLVFADMMTGRHNTLVRLLQALRRDPEVFGDPVPGTGSEPGVLLSGVHHLRKVVAGLPNARPAWYFDVTEQGEGLADTGVHLVDRVHEMLFPEQPLDWQRDIEILTPSRWPTAVNLSQFRELTGEGRWPDDLAPWIRGDVLEYLCNGRVDYRVRGIHVRLEVRWDWQAEQGDDTHHALYRGTRCRVAVRQGPAARFRPELYVLPDENIGAALQRRITYSGMDRAQLGAAYNNSATVPERDAIVTDWAARSAKVRRGRFADQTAARRRLLDQDGVPLAEIVVRHEVDLLFRGQSHVFRVPVTAPGFDPRGGAGRFSGALKARFDIELPEMTAMPADLRTPPLSDDALPSIWPFLPPRLAAREQRGPRQVRFNDGWFDTRLFDRASLGRGVRLTGAAGYNAGHRPRRNRRRR